MFTKRAQFYKIYAFKDYPAEVERLTAIIHEHLRSGGHRLLDVACGTGRHVEYLKEHFDVAGFDINEDLLALAGQRSPDVPFHPGDMVDFDLARQFDVVTCLFSSIGYLKTLDSFKRAVACMARHLVAGGVLIVEPWFTPEDWHTPSVHARFTDEPEFKVARINTSFQEGRLSYFDLHYLIGTPEGTEHFVERHECGQRVLLRAFAVRVHKDRRERGGAGIYAGNDRYRNPGAAHIQGENWT